MFYNQQNITKIEKYLNNLYFIGYFTDNPKNNYITLKKNNTEIRIINNITLEEFLDYSDEELIMLFDY